MHPETIALMIVATPGVVFLCLSAAWLLGVSLGEALLARLTALVYTLLTVGTFLLIGSWWTGGCHDVHIELGHWFHLGEYHFGISLLIDRLSLPLIGLTVFLVGLVGTFSVRYLHRDSGYFRFFLLLHLFAFGVLVLFTAGSLETLIGGWELVGITSVLLIAFFQTRPAPARNALRVFGTYRLADIHMLVGAFVAHHLYGTATWSAIFEGSWPNQASLASGWAATGLALLLVMGASGKAAQGLFAGWLPRAMEGPTPSSAIFYGALSVHAGAYLLLRLEPLFQATPWAAGVVVFIGLESAVLGTLVHRTCTDAKTSLAYASITQLGVIFVEIGLGWSTLALLHLMGHAVVRTTQFLRAPSLLHDHHHVHSASGGKLGPLGEHYEAILPEVVRLKLYRAGLERGYYDALVDRYLILPTQKAARWLLTHFEGQPTIPRSDGQPLPPSPTEKQEVLNTTDMEFTVAKGMKNG